MENEPQEKLFSSEPGRPRQGVHLNTADGLSTTGRTSSLSKRWYNRRQVIDFARRSYLGLDNHPLIVGGAIEAVQANRSFSSFAARTPFERDLVVELEEELSEMFRARVICFSSLLLASLEATRFLGSGQLTSGRKPIIVFDRALHDSLVCHKPVVSDEVHVETIAHNDVNDLKRLCRDNPAVVYVCGDIYPMGAHSRLTELRRLQERYGLFLNVHDAHGISIFGRQGQGFARSQFPQMLGERTIIAASLAEGFGASGGLLMLGTSQNEALCRRYIASGSFSEAPNRAAVGAALASCKIHRSAELGERQQRLVQRIGFFDRRLATAEQGNSLPIRTIIIGSEANAIEVARRLRDSGFRTSVTFFPKCGDGTAGIRVFITSEHEVCDIERLCDGILETIVQTTGKPYPLR
ncbi:7-keto-8-aminopelargonate synthetase [Bradyrhizobium canariense]|uniref:7-keto-8-aminopelargonate synthetase n=1 Tax=Bradyrhizobium canariense TaxID=255045 RepID=UPI000A195555|nr:7-keto-8-aminopelargonate synthetase [Bradyrhizobium canariense]OSI32955.1 7-keto-8-aminopelargonate synthetase [Bradyrhizobium canariense]OSI36929.1 7-keto-8-aminopelargonate synthetase [Bradyrhizobium canariense]OSI50364.1 7-keto-8-aminopelargonate synthetase [Bradyrhizobium canariense]OSI55785.1 7-keto-8-aminopelargonate synthetase [Bradyrhizobium canariense]OSI59052.1 7-keto-8-aminopelargonate synthetase [Bradyrhizobium canariense]